VFKRCLNALLSRLIVIYIKRYGDNYSRRILDIVQGKRGVRDVARELNVNPAKISHSADFLKRLIG